MREAFTHTFIWRGWRYFQAFLARDCGARLLGPSACSVDARILLSQVYSWAMSVHCRRPSGWTNVKEVGPAWYTTARYSGQICNAKVRCQPSTRARSKRKSTEYLVWRTVICTSMTTFFSSGTCRHVPSFFPVQPFGSALSASCEHCKCLTSPEPPSSVLRLCGSSQTYGVPARPFLTPHSSRINRSASERIRGSAKLPT